MNKRPKKILQGIAGGLLAIVVTVSVTGMLQSFNIPVPANKPGLNTGDKIFASSIVSPKLFDFVVFNYFDSAASKKQHHVFRLCGKPGDVVEIRNGDLFVNNSNTASSFDLCLPYTIAAADIPKVQELVTLEDDDLYVSNETPVVFLTQADCEKLTGNKIPFTRKITGKQESNQYIERIYGQPWNEDHFGPLTIPAGKYFVLGDNRHRAQDSRYTGLVPIDDCTGTVVFE